MILRKTDNINYQHPKFTLMLLVTMLIGMSGWLALVWTAFAILGVIAGFAVTALWFVFGFLSYDLILAALTNRR